ncbi:unnamed protein product [Prunus armeniaca]|uniref:Uncharacterized protein n=1 Tax=Prunus armeniaca TaxID=36596 RepID=A0A6J5TCX2_PRUAR|nr:unnamed protein product [Prunus armeniaca]
MWVRQGDCWVVVVLMRKPWAESRQVIREQQEGQVIERLRVELENERERNFQLDMELEILRIQISGAHSSTGAGID